MKEQNKLVLIASHDFQSFPMEVHKFLDSVGSFLLPLDPTSIVAIMEQQSICLLLIHGPFIDSTHQDIYHQVRSKHPDLPILLLLPENVQLSFIEALTSAQTFCHWAPYEFAPIGRNLKEQISRSDSAKTPRPKFTHKHGIVGQSDQIQEVLKLVDVVAPHKTGVLIEGESGTGKELFAQAIHRASQRKGKFVGLNCGAIPRELLESELFGHARGSFSGANSDKRGLFEEAAHGTIFLDEIPELDPLLQVKLTRVMQERQFRRVGDNKLRNVEARFIAATNKNLKELVEKGLFREDLYFRLSIFPIQLPPLRERVEDIPLLAEYFVDLFNTKFDRKVKEISSEVLLAMNAYPWPGNL
ncbi:MAG: sigma 54-interacting transcriptional regulator, partial [Planctomycetota bacterium]|nr:sigma 54-interacting transcriptional regulator [Planctomycetota bacterium]